ncbi:MAG TPA: hypothetical protein VEI97_09000 [bacterium]|nr:hypothetical protein [bacterium]
MRDGLKGIALVLAVWWGAFSLATGQQPLDLPSQGYVGCLVYGCTEHNQPALIGGCAHEVRGEGSFYLVKTPKGTGPDEDFGKSWVPVDVCRRCGVVIVPEEWREGKK